MYGTTTTTSTAEHKKPANSNDKGFTNNWKNDKDSIANIGVDDDAQYFETLRKNNHSIT